MENASFHRLPRQRCPRISKAPPVQHVAGGVVKGGEGGEGAAGADAAHAQVAQLRQDQLRSGAGGQYVERGVDFAHQGGDVG